ncbi:hypothetical protein OROGR_000413 [Orobanche gracilis]
MSSLQGGPLFERAKRFLLSSRTNLPGFTQNAAGPLGAYTSSECSRAIHFRKRCRTYNNTIAFSSLGITYDETLVKSNKGIYTLRIQGAVYHFIRDLMPTEGRGRQIQLYFYDSENELQNRLSQSGDLDPHILEDIIELMKLNPYAVFFRGLRELVNLQEYNVVLRADPYLDMRIYNLPTVNQVAAIWNEITDVPVAQPHDIRVYAFSESILAAELEMDRFGCN